MRNNIYLYVHKYIAKNEKVFNISIRYKVVSCLPFWFRCVALTALVRPLALRSGVPLRIALRSASRGVARHQCGRRSMRHLRLCWRCLQQDTLE